MPDVFTKAKRSEVMSRIRGRGNKDTELALANLLRRHGIIPFHRFTDAVTRRRTGGWWRREHKGLYCPEISLREN